MVCTYYALDYLFKLNTFANKMFAYDESDYYHDCYDRYQKLIDVYRETHGHSCIIGKIHGRLDVGRQF